MDGAGGQGSVTVNELGSILKYPEEEIILKTENIYQIDEEKFYYIKLNEIQTEDLTVGKLIYEIENEEIATISEKREIIAHKGGKTKVKITDQDNGYSTYITIGVIDQEEIYIDDKEIQPNEGNEEYADGTYYYETTEDSVKIKVNAGNKTSTVTFNENSEIYELEQTITLGEQSILVEIPVTITSQEGIIYETVIYINKKSASLRLEKLILDGKEADSYNEQTNTYVFIVEELETEYEISAKAESEYTILKYENIKKNEFTEKIKAEDIEGKSLTITAESILGTTKEYKVDIIHKAKDDESIEYLKVNDKLVNKMEDENYEVKLAEDVENIEIILSIIQQTEGEIDKSIDINNTGVFEKPYKQVTIKKEDFEGKESIQIPIKIAKEDGTIKESVLNIIFQKETYITGRILTENTKGIYTADVAVYRQIKGEVIYSEEVTRVKTNNDGTFKASVHMTERENIEAGERYEIVVTKPGYLDYTVRGIIVIEEQETYVGEYKLIAGDIIKTGEIELDDLVNLNDRYGTASLHPECDLNEDGIINEIDREILKKSYTKRAEIVDLGTNEVSKLNQYITFEYDRTKWTNENIAITLSQTAGDEYILQYSTDNINWVNYDVPIEMSENGLIYARLVDNEGNEGRPVAEKVKNIDKIAPIVNEELTSTEQTPTSIELSISALDNNSGLAKIIWYYKLTTEDEYKSEIDTISRTALAVIKRKTISNLLSGESYDIKVEVYDVVGNMTISEKITVETISRVTLVMSKDKDPVEVPVPKGYVASSVESERTVNGGFVIYEGEEAATEENLETAKRTRNQWIWIPVADASEMYWTDTTTGNIYGAYYDFTSTGYTRGTRAYEPSLVSYDSETYLGISREEFLEEMQQDFKEMLDSVSKYGGFYIGRYETGNLSQDIPVVVQMNTDIHSVNWYNMYKKSKKVKGSNENVTSYMIWGIQWDETLKWLIDSGSKTNEKIATDSTSWGNYKDTTFTYTTTSGGRLTKAINSSTIIPTGSSEYTLANNIYDLAGNVSEWTMEGNEPGSRYSRGGYCYDSGRFIPARGRNVGYLGDSDFYKRL